MKGKKMTGKLLIITGSILGALGVILILVKKGSIVTFMSLPVLIMGIIMSHNAKKDPPVMKR
jgi:hypothetical protein